VSTRAPWIRSQSRVETRCSARRRCREHRARPFRSRLRFGVYIAFALTAAIARNPFWPRRSILVVHAGKAGDVLVLSAPKRGARPILRSKAASILPRVLDRAVPYPGGLRGWTGVALQEGDFGTIVMHKGKPSGAST